MQHFSIKQFNRNLLRYSIFGDDKEKVIHKSLFKSFKVYALSLAEIFFFSLILWFQCKFVCKVLNLGLVFVLSVTYPNCFAETCTNLQMYG